MLRLAPAAVLLFALASPAEAYDPVPVDKAAHFGACYVLTDQLLRAGLGRDEAIGAVLALGWLKEMADLRPDPADMAADVAGTLAAAYFRVEIKF